MAAERRRSVANRPLPVVSSFPTIEFPPAADYALKIRHKVQGPKWEQWYLLVGDCHWDSPECYLKLLHRHLRQAKERNALVIDIGDFFDAISGYGDPRSSKGTLREEHCKVNYLDRLVEDAIDEFRPYLDHFAYMGTGNHEQAVLVRKETDLTARFCDTASRLRANGAKIHRAGYTGWIRFMFEQANGSGRSSHSMKIEHGTGGNSPVTKGTIQANRRASRTEGASLFVSGHIHEQWSLSGPVEMLNDSTSRVELRNVEHMQLGSYKQDFRTDGVATWAQMKMGSPKPIGGMWLRFFAVDSQKRVMWESTRTEVDYQSLHSCLRRSRVEKEPVELTA